MSVMRKPPGGGPTGTIALVVPPEPGFQKPIVVDWAVSGKVKGIYYPMLYFAAYQPDNPQAYAGLNGLVYGELVRPQPEDAMSGRFEFVLAEGSSAWVQSGGGPAHCVAKLHLYPGMHEAPILTLAEVAFEAAG